MRVGQSPGAFVCSRRTFVVGATLWLAGLTMVAGTGASAVVPAGHRRRPESRHLPASVTATGALVERDRATTRLIPSVRRWRCCRSGAELEVFYDGGIRLLRPGWGERMFSVADFSHGQPQDAVRHRFGETVLEELRQTLAGLA